METKELKKAKPVTAEDVKALRHGVEEILERVRAEGDAALAHYSQTFDGLEGPFRVGEDEINAAKEPILNTHTVEAIRVLVRVDAC